MSSSAVAKTVSHSPLRRNPGKASVKNVLDNPLKSRWPVLPQTTILQIKEQLERCLSGMKTTFRRVQPTRRKAAKRKATEVAGPGPKRKCTTSDRNIDQEEEALSTRTAEPSGQAQGGAPNEEGSQGSASGVHERGAERAGERLSAIKAGVCVLHSEKAELSQTGEMVAGPATGTVSSREDSLIALKDGGQQVDPESDSKRDPEYDIEREKLDPETYTVKSKGLDPDSDIKHEEKLDPDTVKSKGLDPESDIKCEKLDQETDAVKSKALDPESDKVNVDSDSSGVSILQPLVVGVNAVTRVLEHGGLQVGLLCTSAPGLLCQHLMSLAATRKVPFAAVPNLSELVANLLGIKRAMCVGIKRTSECTGHFEELIRSITTLTPSVTVPWLAPVPSPKAKSKAAAEAARSASAKKGGRKVGAIYSPLHVKRTKFQPNSKKSKGKK